MPGSVRWQAWVLSSGMQIVSSLGPGCRVDSSDCYRMPEAWQVLCPWLGASDSDPYISIEVSRDCTTAAPSLVLCGWKEVIWAHFLEQASLQSPSAYWAGFKSVRMVEFCCS